MLNWNNLLFIIRDLLISCSLHFKYVIKFSKFNYNHTNKQFNINILSVMLKYKTNQATTNYVILILKK
jgi:hypothetical protein